ncbi:pyridoxal phosphate-dependent aminotransferase [Oceanispirochaeta crateris]|uniref:Aminotransferase n=1 Tax=Oceanispirochaeta crateris TaxID=2518645 RepID=A0A5C1QPR9_9SPIO|nr:pyridoxal phosphate-dependent aminotransferase [Oceanispirochaeta crateris]QEN09651.1 pyridoxal phosphate-dependent aminotransferase [Oceanispirochaeta crateris]
MKKEMIAEEMFASRLDDIPFSGIRKVFDKVRELEAEGREVIHWQVGRPDFDTPQHIKDAAIEAMNRGEVHYSPNLGILPLRKAIGVRTELDTGVPVNGETQSIVMSGANEGILASMLAFVNPGDEVLVTDPNWHHYKSIVSIAGGTPIEIPTTAEDGFMIKPEEVEKRITDKTKILCITSPGNPTGCVLSKENLEALAEIAIRHNLLVISDEIYSRIYFGEERVAPSIYSVPGMAERTIIINGFSKIYAMDGWRLGWTVASEKLTRGILKIRQYTTVCVNTFIQHGAVAGLTGDQTCVDDMVKEFAKRRKIILEGLRSIPKLSVSDSLGAFYVFPDISAYGLTSQEMADYLIQEYGIATVAGSVFGTSGEGHIRIAYSCSTEECTRGVAVLKEALAALK